jgi:hypothetical protein
VVFCFPSCLRVFQKSDGKYVGGIKLVTANDENIGPSCVTTDDANHLYFIDSFQNKLCRMDL